MPPGGGRLSRAHRIRKHSEFQDIQSGGGRVNTRRFVFVMKGGDALDAGPRLGVTASRKVGNAVQRNRAKRLIREAFRATSALWPKGLRLVVIVKGALGEAKLAEVVAEWTAAADLIARRARAALESQSDAKR